MSSENRKKTRFINPPNVFKSSVGTGGIDPARLGQATDYITTLKVDFRPHAKKLIIELEKALKDYREDKAGKDDILGPIIRLKAGGGMFDYNLITAVSDIALQFLDSVDSINEDLLSVIEAHNSALRAILARGLTGSGGTSGHAIITELEKACERYFEKYNEKS